MSLIYETNDDGVKGYWEEAWAPRLDTCPAGAEPMVIRDTQGQLGTPGLYYPACSSTGVVYAPPFSTAALLELLFPDSWSILPPG